MLGTDLAAYFASIRPGPAPGAWHRFGCLFASIDPALHLVPGTDLAACLLASDLATHRVPGTDLAAYLLASDLATHRVPGTDLAAYLLASDLFPHLVPGTDLADCLLASTGSGRRPNLRWICTAPGAWHRLGPPIC